MGRTSYTGARVFDGAQFREGALVVEEGRVLGFGAAEGHVVDLGGGILAPGFLDLQVNGSGGLAIDGSTDLAVLETVCTVQARLGATGCLPTLITDTYDATARVVEAGIAATKAQVPGFLGLHLEGPHLDPRRKGAHDAALIRRMEARDLALVLEAAAELPALMVTVAPVTGCKPGSPTGRMTPQPGTRYRWPGMHRGRPFGPCGPKQNHAAPCWICPERLTGCAPRARLLASGGRGTTWSCPSSMPVTGT
jgi:hypothetical protein